MSWGQNYFASTDWQEILPPKLTMNQNFVQNCQIVWFYLIIHWHTDKYRPDNCFQLSGWFASTKFFHFSLKSYQVILLPSLNSIVMDKNRLFYPLQHNYWIKSSILPLSKSKDTNHQATIIGKDNKTWENGQHACPSGASSVLNMGKHLAPSGHGWCPRLCPKFP